MNKNFEKKYLKTMKNISKKLAIIKLPQQPDKKDLEFIGKIFKGTQYKPICITTNFTFKQGNLIIGYNH